MAGMFFGPRRPDDAERDRARGALRSSARERRAERRKMREEDRAAARDSREQEAARRRESAESIQEALLRVDREAADRARASREARRRATDAYDAIGFTDMFADGDALTEEGLYSRTLEVSDVSFLKASEERQEEVALCLEQLCRAFSANVSLQWTVRNDPLPTERPAPFGPVDPGLPEAAAVEAFSRDLARRPPRDAPAVRTELFLTVATLAPTNPEAAARALDDIQAVVAEHLSRAGSCVRKLTFSERLSLVASVTRPGQPVFVDYERDVRPLLLSRGRSKDPSSPSDGVHVKDFVCPCRLDFRPNGMDDTVYVAGDAWCSTMCVVNLPETMTGRFVSAVAETGVPLNLSWHMQPREHYKAERAKRGQAVNIDDDLGRDQSKAFSQGRSIENANPELKELSDAVHADRAAIQAGHREHEFSCVIMVWAPDPASLRSARLKVGGVAMGLGVTMESLSSMQRDGMNSVLPMANNHCRYMRELLDYRLSVFVPFSNVRLDRGRGVLLGRNADSGTDVILDRARGMNGHMLVTGRSGSGKSMLLSHVAVFHRCMQLAGEDPCSVVIVDPTAGTYGRAVEAFGGSVLEVGPGCPGGINLLELPDDRLSTWRDRLAWKHGAVVAGMEAVMLDRSECISAAGRSIVNRCLDRLYRRYQQQVSGLAAGAPAPAQPTLGDLVRCIRSQPEREAKELALAFEGTVGGSALAFMDTQSSVPDNPDFLLYDLHQVPDDMMPMAMVAVLERVRNLVLDNHAHGRRTWLFIDEVQALTGHPSVLALLARHFREERKHGLGIFACAQDPQALCGDGFDDRSDIVRQAENVVAFPGDSEYAEWYAEKLGLSDEQRAAIGEGGAAARGVGVAKLEGHVLTLDARLHLPAAEGDGDPTAGFVYGLFNSDPVSGEAPR